MNAPQRISSNLSIFLKLFIPTFWFVFYGAITLALFVPNGKIVFFRDSSMKIAALFFYLSGSIVLYFSLLQLKRVEFDSDFLYVSNYFRTSRIPWHNIEKMKTSKMLVFTIIHVRFKEKTSHGKGIFFLPSRSLWKLYKKEILSHLEK